MEIIVSVEDNPLSCRNTAISKRDLIAILNVAPKYISTRINVLDAARLLQLYGFISQDSYKNLLRKLQIYGNNFRGFLIAVLEFVSFNKLVKFLRVMRCCDFADELWRTRYGDNVKVIDGADIGVSEDILIYYSRTKCYMDDNVFIDRKAELEKRFDDLRLSICELTNHEKKVKAVNKLAVVTFLRISQYRDRDTRERILNEMRASITPDVDPTFPEVVYFGKMANTAAFAGDTAAAKRYIQNAQRLTENCKQTFVKIFAHHDEQYIYRYLFSNNPSDEYLKNALVSGELGLHVLGDLSDEKATIWRKVFISENAMSLLKIKNNFDILYTQEVGEKDRRAAAELMANLGNTTGSNEKRREMVNCLCKGRIHEGGNIQLAQDYADQAVQCALEGSHFPADIDNITRYSQYLRENTDRKQIHSTA